MSEKRRWKNGDASMCDSMCVLRGDCPLSDVGISMWGCPAEIVRKKGLNEWDLSDLERKLAELKLKIEQKKLELKE